MLVDVESRATHDDHLSVRVWLRLLTCTNIVEGRVAARLRDDFATTLPRFDFLSQLERVPGGLRMTDISKRMMVTGGNITAIADQLLAEGLITRTPAPRDRRAAIVRLSASGRRAFGEMARAHEEWIVRMFAGLDERERTQLYRLLAKLKGHLNAETPDERQR